MDSSHLSTTVSFAPGDFVVREKTQADALYIIKEGQLEVFKIGSNGEKIPLAIISSGEYVGETAILLDTPYSSNVVALTPVTALKLSRAAIESQLKAVPAWLLALTKGLAVRLHRSNELLRRNTWVDQKITESVKAVGDKFKKPTG